MALPNENELIRQWQQEKNYVARDKVILSHKGMVCKLAFKYPVPYGYEQEDIIQEGMLGLFTAIDRYTIDYKNGCKFLTYATWAIRRSMTKFLMQNVNGMNYYGKCDGITKLIPLLGKLDTSSHASIEVFAAEHDVPYKDIMFYVQSKLLPNPDVTDEFDTRNQLYQGAIDDRVEDIIDQDILVKALRPLSEKEKIELSYMVQPLMERSKFAKSYGLNGRSTQYRGRKIVERLQRQFNRG